MSQEIRLSRADAENARPEATPAGASRAAPVAALPTGVDRIDVLCDRLELAERRLKEMADGYAAVLENLAAVDRKHTGTVAMLNERLGDWCNVERKLLEESARRIERFERGVGHEWTVLRHMHEESIQSVHEQAGEIRRLCGEAAGAVQMHLEAAEGAYSTRATELEQQMREWARHLLESGRTALATPAAPGAELTPAGAATAVHPFSLEGVAQLHHELRNGSSEVETPPALASALKAASEERAAPGRARPASPEETHPGAADLYRAMGYGPSRPRRRLAWWAAGCAVALVFGGFALYANSLRGQIDALERRSRDVARQAADDRDRLRDAAERQGQSALRAEALVQILAAPDLYRLPLAGLEPAPGAFGQALWSRSRGIAVTASRLPPPADGKTYCVWAMSPTAVAGLGMLYPDRDGRASLVTAAAPAGTLRPPSIVITLEDRPNASQPTGQRFLASPPGLSAGSNPP